MRVLVTGGAGFIGSHVAGAFLADGCEVAVIDDLSTGRRANIPDSARFDEVDIREADAVKRVIADFRPDAVSHHAAQASVAASVRDPLVDAEVNVLGSINLLSASQAHGVSRFVFASTGGAIYGEVPPGTRAGVDARPCPLSPYACSKLAIELYLEAFRSEHGLGYTILRYSNVYGPRQDPHGEAGVIAIFARRALAGERLQVNARAQVGDDGCIRDYVYIDDVVEANRAAIRGELESRVANVCTGEGTSTRALAELIRTAAKSSSEIVSAPRRPGDLERSVLEPHAALAAKTDLPEGLARTLDWFRAKGGER